MTSSIGDLHQSRWAILYFEVPLLLCLLLVVSALLYRTKPSFSPQDMSRKNNYLQALMFSSAKTLDVYNFLEASDEEDYAYYDEGLYSVTNRKPGLLISSSEKKSILHNVDLTTLSQIAYFSGGTLTDKTQHFSLSDDRNILITTNTGVFLYATNEKQLYKIDSQPNIQLAAIDKNQLQLVVAMKQGTNYLLHLTYPGCKQTKNFVVTSRTRDVASFLQKNGLQPQQVIKFAPAQKRIMILDHKSMPNIVILDLLSNEVLPLRVPFLSDRQVHFSPTFLSDNDLAFSVIDGNAWMTIQYDLQTKAYQILSSNFSDGIYISNFGKPVLVQSFMQQSNRNIPFGSPYYLREHNVLDRRWIELVFTTNQIWKSFVILDGDRATFVPSLVLQDFERVEDKRERNLFLSAWLEGKAQGAISSYVSLIRLDGDKQVVLNSVNSPRRAIPAWLALLSDATPLLDALEVPHAAKQAYLDRRQEILSQDGEYVLVGTFR